ncbi:hypothetical protein [Pseudomonas sp. TH15]|uniref:hypothetical protein n=1 Tax=Pseudomonas sp. TH15 TaxID=2796381 RepID=UPI0019144D91|nr:hypothetical protein [Pseudomonas sp. TH15]MBK5512730.1 hypothetical protein [Pseudomonas sp. TH15]
MPLLFFPARQMLRCEADFRAFGHHDTMAQTKRFVAKTANVTGATVAPLFYRNIGLGFHAWKADA